MRLGQLIEGRFIERLNRFAALVEIDGRESLVHVANSGRMKELLLSGNRVLVMPVDDAHRRPPPILPLWTWAISCAPPTPTCPLSWYKKL